MYERAKRVGVNEALFRQVNERVKGLNDTFGELTDEFSVVCECGSLDCAERIAVSPARYEQTRADSALFLIRSGHEEANFEDVVERGNGFLIVRKKPGLPEDLAEATDTRA